eukprot:10224628-Alexandrium_andersonii.AAC.1
MLETMLARPSRPAGRAGLPARAPAAAPRLRLGATGPLRAVVARRPARWLAVRREPRHRHACS